MTDDMTTALPPRRDRRKPSWLSRLLRLLRLPISGIVLAVNLIAIVLPVGGILALRVYETELVRQTEAELLAQGAFSAAAFIAALGLEPGRLTADGTVEPGLYDDDLSRPLLLFDTVLAEARREIERNLTEGQPDAQVYTPRTANLDLAVDRALPPAPETTPADRSPDPRAVAAGQIITPILRAAQRSTLAGIRVVDANGIVVASTAGQLGHDMSVWPEVRRALDGAHVSQLRTRITDDSPPLGAVSRAAAVRVFVAVPMIHGNRIYGAVILSRTPRDLLRALYPHRYGLYAAGGVLLSVVLVLVLLTSAAISRPLRAVATQARRAAGGDLQAVAPLRRPITREVGAVSDAVVQLTDSLIARERYIRDFARQISHELMTPIANVVGATEILIDDDGTMPPEQREKFLTNIAGNGEKMQRLVQRLLTLARAEVERPDPAQSFGFDQVFAQATEDLSLVAPDALTIRNDVTRPDEGAPMVSIDPDALETVLASLVENALQHGGPDVRVTVAAAGGANGIQIRISDTGPGIPPQVAARIFEPFYTTAQAIGATGLGLAIVKSTLDAHRGSVTLDAPGEGEGAVFVIRLPVRMPTAA